MPDDERPPEEKSKDREWELREEEIADLERRINAANDNRRRANDNRR